MNNFIQIKQKHISGNFYYFVVFTYNRKIFDNDDLILEYIVEKQTSNFKILKRLKVSYRKTTMNDVLQSNILKYLNCDTPKSYTQQELKKKLINEMYKAISLSFNLKKII